MTWADLLYHFINSLKQSFQVKAMRIWVPYSTITKLKYKTWPLWIQETMQMCCFYLKMTLGQTIAVEQTLEKAA